MELVAVALLIGVAVLGSAAIGIFVGGYLDTATTIEGVNLTVLSVKSHTSSDELIVTVQNSGTTTIDGISFIVGYDGIESNPITITDIIMTGNSKSLREDITADGTTTPLGFMSGEEVTVYVNGTTSKGSTFNLDPQTITVN